jgi:hypothetical protein
MNTPSKTKLIITLLIAIAIVVIAVPVYYYVTTFKNTGLSRYPADWGVFGDYFGGILNPIVSLLTLFATGYIAYIVYLRDATTSRLAIEMTYKPDLVIEAPTFQVYSRSNKSFMIPYEFSYERLGLDHISNYLKSTGFHVNLFNIGHGPAKAVKVKCLFDVQACFTLIQSFGHPEDSSNDVKHAIEGKHLKIYYPTEGPSIQQIEPQNNWTLSHLLTTTITPTPYTLRVPNYILDLYRAFLFNVNRYIHRRGSGDIPDFTSIVYQLTYNDIGGKEHIEKIKVVFQYGGGSVMEALSNTTVSEL